MSIDKKLQPRLCASFRNGEECCLQKFCTQFISQFDPKNTKRSTFVTLEDDTTIYVKCQQPGQVSLRGRVVQALILEVPLEEVVVEYGPVTGYETHPNIAYFDLSPSCGLAIQVRLSSVSYLINPEDWLQPAEND